MCPACDLSSFAPCLLKEADTEMFARVTETAKRLQQEISSCTVDSGHTCCATAVRG